MSCFQSPSVLVRIHGLIPAKTTESTEIMQSFDLPKKSNKTTTTQPYLQEEHQLLKTKQKATSQP